MYSNLKGLNHCFVGVFFPSVFPCLIDDLTPIFLAKFPTAVVLPCNYTGDNQRRWVEN